MRAFVAVTDFDWYRYLSAQPNLDEVNFWQPPAGRAFRALEPGELFLFKLHSPRNFIMGGVPSASWRWVQHPADGSTAGGGFFAYWTALPVGIVWSTFAARTGAASLREMRERIERYRRKPPDHHEDYTIGCLLVQEPFFLEPDAWIPVPGDWQAKDCGCGRPCNCVSERSRRPGCRWRSRPGTGSLSSNFPVSAKAPSGCS